MREESNTVTVIRAAPTSAPVVSTDDTAAGRVTPSASDVLQRDSRQRDVIPPEKLADCHALVVGVGAVGRQVALQLAAVGVPCLDLVDHDQVGIENLATQGYWHFDVGTPKVEATGEACRLLNPAVSLSLHFERFRRSSVKTLPAFLDGDRLAVVFCCVDSIETRRLVWESVRPHAALFVDGRMSAEVIRVLASDDPGSGAQDASYSATLFRADQAYAGPCTARSTIYTASIAAGLMLSAFTRWLRGMAVEPDLTLNLLAGELSVGSHGVPPHSIPPHHVPPHSTHR